MTFIERPDRKPPATCAGEDDTVWTMLDYYRETLVLKCADLSDSELRRQAVPPSTLSLLGLLRHMCEVELYWFGQILSGEVVTYPYDPENVGAEFDNVDDSTGVEVIATYRQCVSLASGWVAGSSLDQLATEIRSGAHAPVNLRFIVVHLIEEYARHCGHADLLREVIDGSKGD